MSVARARRESALPVVAVRRPADLPGAFASLSIPTPRSIGVELDVVPVAAFERLRRVFPGVEFRDVSRAVREVRAIKTPYEIAWIERAGRQVVTAMDEALPPHVVRGAREADLGALLEDTMRRKGHQGIVRVRRWNLEMHYGTVSAGASARYPCYFDGPDGLEGLYPAVQQGGGARVLAPGDLVLVDYVGGAGGYLADRARIFSLGPPSAEARAAHGFCRELLADIVERLRPGAIPAEIHAAILERATKSPWADRFMGWGENQVSFLGHGVGLDLDEFPVLAEGFEMPLAPGHVIAVEPKVFLADGPVGVENTYVVTAGDARNLTPGPEDIRVVPA
jgi:Xaa-Pro aminopeptidase